MLVDCMNVAESAVGAASVEASMNNTYMQEGKMLKRWFALTTGLCSGGMLPCGFLWMFQVYLCLHHHRRLLPHHPYMNKRKKWNLCNFLTKQQCKHVHVQTHLIFWIRECSLLHSFVKRHEICETLVPEKEATPPPHCQRTCMETFSA